MPSCMRNANSCCMIFSPAFHWKSSKFFAIIIHVLTTREVSFHPFSGTARIIRAGPGTENVKVEVLQKFFRANGWDNFAGEKSFMFGKSTANQVKLRCFRSETPTHKTAFMLAGLSSSTCNTSQSLGKLNLLFFLPSSVAHWSLVGIFTKFWKKLVDELFQGRYSLHNVESNKVALHVWNLSRLELEPLIYQEVTGDLNVRLCSLQDLRDSGEFKDCDPVHMYVVNRPYAWLRHED